MRLVRFGLLVLTSCLLTAPVAWYLLKLRNPSLTRFFASKWRFRLPSSRTLESGKTIVRLPKTPETREVAAFAIM